MWFVELILPNYISTALCYFIITKGNVWNSPWRNLNLFSPSQIDGWRNVLIIYYSEYSIMFSTKLKLKFKSNCFYNDLIICEKNKALSEKQTEQSL